MIFPNYTNYFLFPHRPCFTMLLTFQELTKVCTNLFFQDKHKGIEHLIEVENPNRMKGRAIKKVTELEGGKTELTRRERYVFIEDWILKRKVI